MADAGDAAQLEQVGFWVGATDATTFTTFVILISADSSGRVVFEDSEGVMALQFSDSEHSEFMALLRHPSLAEFVVADVLPCTDGSSAGAALALHYSDDTDRRVTGIDSCLGGKPNDLGQIEYAVQMLYELLWQRGESELDCPRPPDLTDGLSDEPTTELRPICRHLWGRLTWDEHLACRAGTIAVGVEDCSG